MEKAEKIRDRVLEHAEEKYEDKQPSKPVAYTDFIPRELQKQLASSSIPRDLVEPIVDYYLKMEMMETGCGSLSDLNLVGETSTRAHSIDPVLLCLYRIRGLRGLERQL